LPLTSGFADLTVTRELLVALGVTGADGEGLFDPNNFFNKIQSSYIAQQSAILASFIHNRDSLLFLRFTS
jgi:hypothetical protein